MGTPCWIEIPARDVSKLKVRLVYSKQIPPTKLKQEIELLCQPISELGISTFDRRIPRGTYSSVRLQRPEKFDFPTRGVETLLTMIQILAVVSLRYRMTADPIINPWVPASRFTTLLSLLKRFDDCCDTPGFVLTGPVRLKLEFMNLVVRQSWKRSLSRPMAGS